MNVWVADDSPLVAEVLPSCAAWVPECAPEFTIDAVPVVVQPE